MHYAYCLSSEAGIRAQLKHGRSSPMLQRLYQSLPVQISHAHAQCTSVCDLFIRTVEFGRFLEQFRITANACYYFPRCPTAASTEASELTAGKSQLPSSQCSRAKIRRISETAKRFCDFVRNKRKVVNSVEKSKSYRLDRTENFWK